MALFDKIAFGDALESDAEFIPLISSEDEEKMQNEEVPAELPILPLRNTVLFPGVVIPITVGRDRSIKLIKEANLGDKVIGVVAQKDVSIEEPTAEDLNRIGTVARILRMFQMPDGNTTVIIQGKRRFQIDEIIAERPYFRARSHSIEEKGVDPGDQEFKASVTNIREMALQIIQDSPQIPTEAQFAIRNIDSPSFLINFISSNMNLDVGGKQKLLEESDLRQRAAEVLKHLTTELQMLEVRNEIQNKVRTDIDQQQKEYFLHQQMKTIQEELGEKSYDVEIEEMREKGRAKKWTEQVAQTFDKELDKLKRMNPQAPDFTVQRNYLELLLELPWGEYTDDNFDLKHAEKVLERDHFGLEKVKERIIEHLAVLKIKGDMKSPILCLYGPPGVGKTSLGKSIAEALNRNYVRMSLGGLRDEAEIRGHRKTYIGAMPGRIIQSLKKAGSSNPVFVLDEIDKLTRDLHGDPSSAMLEVLDPEQNKEFYDNYLEMGYDLSQVMFIATANSLHSIQPALRDRMEIIDISGYTVEEKVEIAHRHLLPKQLDNHGLNPSQLKVRKKVYEPMIEGYTRESGVRGIRCKRPRQKCGEAGTLCGEEYCHGG
jgi:ATP-dependent Lon protease